MHVLEAVDQRLRRVLGEGVNADEARALGEWYATISEAVATFPSDDLRGAEPPLRSTPCPRQGVVAPAEDVSRCVSDVSLTVTPDIGCVPAPLCACH